MVTIRDIFTKQKSGETAIIGYLPCGYPDEETFLDMVSNLSAYGLKLMELGIPVDRPGLDGQIIQDAMSSIMGQGISIRKGLEIGGRAVNEAQCAGIAMFYKEIFNQIAPQEFLETCKQYGISGILPVGMSSEEWLAFADVVSPHGLEVISFIDWGYDADIIKKLLKKTSGFAYVQSSQGATGRHVSFGNAVQERITLVKSLAGPLNIPVAVGFGIHDASDASRVNHFGVDGIIVGTALVEAAGQGQEKAIDLIKSLIEAVERK